MTKEQLDKIRDEMAYNYSGKRPSHMNCWSCCDGDCKYEDAFSAGFDAAAEILLKEIERLKEIEFMYNGLCK